MSKILQNEVDKLHTKLLSLCAAVEKNLVQATRAIESADTELAGKVIETDSEIDQLEVQLEEEGLKILALHQPVAVDLRVIVASLKINNDLERIGDLAVRIAKQAILLSQFPVSAQAAAIDFEPMIKKVNTQLSRGLDSLVRLDVGLAREVCASDKAIDAMHREHMENGEQVILGGGPPALAMMHLLGVSRSLERIADHASNIAEDVIYIMSGDIVRHRKERVR